MAEALDITRETYLAIVMDRAYEGPVLVGSPAGGVDIEEVAASTPEKIFKAFFFPGVSCGARSLFCSSLLQIPIDIFDGISTEQAKQMAENLEFKGVALEEVYLLASRKVMLLVLYISRPLGRSKHFMRCLQKWMPHK